MCEINVMPEELVPDELMPGVPGAKTLKRLVADKLLVEQPIGTVIQIGITDIEKTMDLERFIADLDHAVYAYGARMGMPLRLVWNEDREAYHGDRSTNTVLFKVQYD
jgi:hypothetical protein